MEFVRVQRIVNNMEIICKLMNSVAKQYGCETLTDAGQWARDRDGLGADVVIDAAGVSSTLKLALELVRPAGWITKASSSPNKPASPACGFRPQTAMRGSGLPRSTSA